MLMWLIWLFVVKHFSKTSQSSAIEAFHPAVELVIQNKKVDGRFGRVFSVIFPLRQYHVFQFYFQERVLVKNVIYVFWLSFLITLREEIFAGRNIREYWSKVAKMNSFIDPQKCRFAKINSSEIFWNWWFARMISCKIFQKLMKCEYWGFCLIQCLLH